MTQASWKSGSRVRLARAWANQMLFVIGYDSVGSVICRPIDDGRHRGVYVTPSLLISADEKSPLTPARPF